jgi:putative cell wall-binding protein
MDEHFRPFSKLVMLTSKSKKGKPWTEARKKAQVDRQLAGKVSKLKGVPKNKKRKYENIS